MADMYPDDFYLTKRWEQMRLRILRRDRYECQWSKRYKAVPDQAECVHHIFPLEYFPEYKWEPWNLISLSMQAHNRMHDRETHELTREGYELLYRTARAISYSERETYLIYQLALSHLCSDLQ